MMSHMMVLSILHLFISSFPPQSSPRKLAFLSPFYRCRNWGPWWLRSLAQSHQLGINLVGIANPSLSDLKAGALPLIPGVTLIILTTLTTPLKEAGLFWGKICIHIPPCHFYLGAMFPRASAKKVMNLPWPVTNLLGQNNKFTCLCAGHPPGWILVTASWAFESILFIFFLFFHWEIHWTTFTIWVKDCKGKNLEVGLGEQAKEKKEGF